MNIVQVNPSNNQQVQEFLALPFLIYRNIPQWVPPLLTDERLRLNPKRYPFYRHSSAVFFIACHNGQTIGRLAVLEPNIYNTFNNEKTAFFYLFECTYDPNAASELFNAGFEWARSRGLKKILGPKGFTAMDGLGLLVKGFDRRPAFGLPYNPFYYPAFIEAQGFEMVNEIVSGYLSVDLHFPERIHQLSARIQERRDLHVKSFHSRGELRAASSHLKTLYNDALKGTDGGAPISDDEIKALINQMMWYADPNLIKIVMKGEKPVGFMIAYPDISAALQKTNGRLFPFGWITILHELRTTDWININGAGMVEEYRGLGGTAILYSEMFRSVVENPRYRHAEVVQIGLENDMMQRDLENFGVTFYKKHRMYQRDLS